jgi:hypothetical protein
MTIRPNGELPFGRIMGGWFVYSVVIALFAAYLTGRTRAPGTPFLEVFRVSGTWRSAATCSRTGRTGSGGAGVRE